MAETRTDAKRQENVSRWMENMLKPGDRYLLHGIAVEPDYCECHGHGERFIIPRLGPLVELMQSNPGSHEAQWLVEDKKWVAILPSLNG